MCFFHTHLLNLGDLLCRSLLLWELYIFYFNFFRRLLLPAPDAHWFRCLIPPGGRRSPAAGKKPREGLRTSQPQAEQQGGGQDQVRSAFGLPEPRAEKPRQQRSTALRPVCCSVQHGRRGRCILRRNRWRPRDSLQGRGGGRELEAQSPQIPSGDALHH